MGVRPKWTLETEKTAERSDKWIPETEETESGVRPKRTPETEDTSERSDKWALET